MEDRAAQGFFLLHHPVAQALRLGGQRGRQAGRAGAHDQHVQRLCPGGPAARRRDGLHGLPALLGSLADQAHAAEAQWVAVFSAADGYDWPSRSFARWLVRRFGPTLLHAGSGASAVMAAGLVIALLALVARGFALAVSAFLLAALAALIFELVGLIAQVEARARLEAADRGLAGLIGGWASDLLLLVLASILHAIGVDADALNPAGRAEALAAAAVDAVSDLLEEVKALRKHAGTGAPAVSPESRVSSKVQQAIADETVRKVVFIGSPATGARIDETGAVRSAPSLSGCHCAVYPPSITSSAPVTNFASSEARYTTPHATSSGSPTWPIGCFASSAFLTSVGSPRLAANDSTIGVQMNAGWIELTRMR